MGGEMMSGRSLEKGQMWCTDCDNVGPVADRCGDCGSGRVVTQESALEHEVTRRFGRQAYEMNKEDEQALLKLLVENED